MLTRSQQSTFKALVLRDGAKCVWCSRDLTISSDETRITTLVRHRAATTPRILANSLLSCAHCDRVRGKRSASEWLFACVDSGLQPNWQAVESAARLLLELSRTRYRKQHGPLRIHITGEVDRLCAGRNRHEKGTVGKRRRLVMRDGQGCVWCDKDLLPSAPDCTIEHIIPRVYGGKNLLENTACACLNCNSRRSARGVAAWTVDCELRGLHPRKDVLISLLQTLALREDASGRAARRELLAFENAEQPTLSLLPA